MQNFTRKDIEQDFDLSIVLPYFKKYREFSKVLPLNAKYFQRNGIEVLLVLDEDSEAELILELIDQYPLINWVVLVNRETHEWRNPAKAINVGIKHSSKRFIMVCSPESYLATDAIYYLRYYLHFHENVFAIGNVYFTNDLSANVLSQDKYPYGSLMIEKKRLVDVGCYSELYDSWGGDDDNVRAKLEYFGYKKLIVSEALLAHYEDTVYGMSLRKRKSQQIADDIYFLTFYPSRKNFTQNDWGLNFSEKLIDYRDNKKGYEKCKRYLRNFNDFVLMPEDKFNVKRTVIGLIHTRNEFLNIRGIIEHLEIIADGFILLDDCSEDETYELALSSKMICKMKKNSRASLNELENKNILLDLASFVTCEWLFMIDADERFHLFGKSLAEILLPHKKAYCINLVHLWGDENSYRVDIPENSLCARPGVLQRWRFFRNIGRCQIISDLRFHFKHTPFQEYPIEILPALIFHYGMIDANLRCEKYKKYIKEEAEENHSSYSYFLDYGIELRSTKILLSELSASFPKTFV